MRAKTEIPVVPKPLFLDMKLMLLTYKEASPVKKLIILTKAMAVIQSLPEQISSRKETIAANTEFTYAATLIKCADLNDSGSQQVLDEMQDLNRSITTAQGRNFLQRVADFQNQNVDELQLADVQQNQALNRHEIDYSEVYDQEQYTNAKTSLLNEAQRVFTKNATAVSTADTAQLVTDLQDDVAKQYPEGASEINSAITDYQKLVEKELQALKNKKSLPIKLYEASLGRIVKQLEKLTDKCAVVLKSDKEPLLKKIAYTLAVVTAILAGSVMGAIIGAASGFVSGATMSLWTGPGAIVNGIVWAILGAMIGAGTNWIPPAAVIATAAFFKSTKEPVSILAKDVIEFAASAEQDEAAEQQTDVSPVYA